LYLGTDDSQTGPSGADLHTDKISWPFCYSTSTYLVYPDEASRAAPEWHARRSNLLLITPIHFGRYVKKNTKRPSKNTANDHGRRLQAKLLSLLTRSDHQYPNRFVIEQLDSRILFTTNTWSATAGGDWDTATNWSLGHVPTATEDAVIVLGPSRTITHSRNSADSVNSVTCSAALNISSGSLNVANTIQVTGLFSLNNGALIGGTIVSGTTLTLGNTQNNTINRVTVASGATVDESVGNSALYVTGGLTLNGTLELGSSTGSASSLYFTTTETLAGTGSVVIGSSSANGIAETAGTGTLTIASGITIIGNSGSLYCGSGYGGNDTIINNGTIEANTSGGTISVGNGAISGLVGSFTNNGSVIAANGATLKLYYLTNSAGANVTATGSTITTYNNWNNSGTINATNSTLNLGGTFTLGGSGTLTRSGGTINLTGTLNNTGAMLALNAATGSWVLAGGTINGITVSSGSIIDSTTTNTSIYISGGMVLNGTLELGNSTGDASSLYFTTTETLDGTGTVVIGSSGNGIDITPTSGTLTIGGGMTLRTASRFLQARRSTAPQTTAGFTSLGA
jgi:hypothetical protein